MTDLDRAPWPNELVAYARQRHYMISEACKLGERLNIPEVTSAPPAAQLEALKVLWAVTVPAELMTVYARFSFQRFQEVRQVITERELPELKPLEHLIGRDLDLFRGAQELRGTLLDDKLSGLVEEVYPVDFTAAMATAGAKLVTALPLVTLLAWEEEWLQALRVLSEVFEGVDLPGTGPSEQYKGRLEVLEDKVVEVSRKLDAAGALFRARSDTD